MKSSKEVLSRLKKGDYFIVGTVIFLSALFFVLSFFSSESLKAEIYLDGELQTVINLYELDEGKHIEVGGCKLFAEKDGISFASSACPDKLCVNRGKLKKAGDTMACVPERVSVVLKGEKDGIDAVVF